MKFYTIIFALFLSPLLVGISLLAADQGRVSTVLDTYVGFEKDATLLEGLSLASGLVSTIKAQNFLSSYQDYQYMDTARCQYQTSVMFQKMLEKTITQVHSKEVKVKLSGLFAELNKIHTENNPYMAVGQQWPSSVETCRTNYEKYQALLGATQQKIKKIANSHQIELPTGPNTLIRFLETSTKDKQLWDEEMQAQVQSKIEQNRELMQATETLQQKHDALLAQINEANEEIRRLRALKSVLDEETKRRKESFAAQTAALEAELQTRSQQNNAKIALMVTNMDAEAERLKQSSATRAQEIAEKYGKIETSLRAKLASMEAQLNSISSLLADKKTAVNHFSVALGNLIEQGFLNTVRDLVEIEGMAKTNPSYEPLKANLTRMINARLHEFEGYLDQRTRPEAKPARFQFLLKIDHIDSEKRYLSATGKWIISGALAVRVMHLNITKERQYSRQIFKFYEEGGLISEKNAGPIAAIDFLFKEIPSLKQETFDRAHSPGNRQLLYAQAADILKNHPTAAVTFEGGASLQPPPFAKAGPEDASPATASPRDSDPRRCLFCERPW